MFVVGYADALKKASIDFSDEQNDTKPDVKSNTNKTNTKRNIPALVPATVIPKPSKQNSTTVNVSGDDQGLTDISSDWVLNKYIDDENSPNARPNKSSNAEISPDITFGSFNDAPGTDLLRVSLFCFSNHC